MKLQKLTLIVFRTCTISLHLFPSNSITLFVTSHLPHQLLIFTIVFTLKIVLLTVICFCVSSFSTYMASSSSTVALEMIVLQANDVGIPLTFRIDVDKQAIMSSLCFSHSFQFYKYIISIEEVFDDITFESTYIVGQLSL